MSKTKTYAVTVPIAGHAYIEVEAESEEDAIDKALVSITSDHLETWESMRTYNDGNVCHCPSPWEASAECLDDEQEPSP